MRLSHLTYAVAALTLAGSCSLWAADRVPNSEPRPVVNVRAALGETVHELSVDGIALSRVLDFLRDTSGANIVVNWKVLESAGISRDTAITLQVRELTLRKMLQLVLNQASPTSALTYTIDANVLEITTQDEADKKLLTKVYIVDDLVMTDNRNIKAPNMNLEDSTKSGTSSGTGGGGSVSGGGSLFETDSSSTSSGNEDTTQKRGEDLVTLIREVVRPTIWKEAGGPASIRYFSGKLIVTAPASVHEAIGGPVGDAQRFGM